MTYTPNVPLVGQNINTTQPIINANFTAINTWVLANHTGFNLGNLGTHQAIQMEQQGSVYPGTDPTTSSSQIGFYNKLDNLSIQINRLWIREPSNGAVRQLTGNVINEQATGIGTLAGETMILGGLVVKYGTIPVSSSSTTTNWTAIGLTNFPNTFIGITATPINATTSLKASGTTTNFLINVGSSCNVFFIAIGN